QLLCSGERNLEPVPALFLFKLFDALFVVHLEAGVGETAVGFNVRFGAPQLADVLDAPAGDEVIGINEVTDGPDHPRRKRFGIYFRAEFGRPFHAASVAHANFRVRAGHTFFDERERWFGRRRAPADTPDKIQTFDRAGVMPKNWLARLTGLFLFLFRLL